MRRWWIVALALLAVILVGCGDGETVNVDGFKGDCYWDYTLTESQTGWSVKAGARVENSLAFVELENAGEDPASVDMALSFKSLNDEGFRLYYVTEEVEELLWTVGRNDVAEGVRNLGTTLSNTLEVAPGQSWLELRPLDEAPAAGLEFELTLKHEGGKALSAATPGDLANGLAGQTGFSSVTGDYFVEYTLTEKEGSWLASGTAHVEAGLALVELENAGEVPVFADFWLTTGRDGGDMNMVCVEADGAERTMTSGKGTIGKGRLSVTPGKSWLELRPKDEAAVGLEFELTLKHEGGKALSVKMPGGLEDGLEELENGLPDIGGDDNDGDDNNEKENGYDRTQYIIVSGIEVELAAGESLTLLEFAPEAKCRLNLQADLRDIRGDVALVYVGPGGKERQLWSRAARPESEDVKVVYSDGVSMPIELEPGEGRLEWRSEAGASFVETLLWDGVDKAGVLGI